MSVGPCVLELQTWLVADGVSPHLAIDGQFGYETLQAVKKFQGEMGLPPSGVLDPRTISALDQPEAAGDIKPLGSSDLTPVGSTWHSAEQLFGPVTVAICGVVVLVLIVAAMCRVKILSVKLTWHGFEFHLHRHPSRHQVTAQAHVLAKALEVEANYPGRLPGLNDYMRSIEGGDEPMA